MGTFGDEIDHARHRVGAPYGAARTANDLDLLDLRHVHRQKVPHHEPEEIEIERPAIEKYELSGGQAAGCRSSRHLDVSSADLRDVEPWNSPQNVTVVISGQLFEIPCSYDRDGSGNVMDQPL